MHLLNMSLTAGVLIVLIIVARALLMHKVPKTAFLILWGVAVFRLLIPGTLSPLNLLVKAGLISPNAVVIYEASEGSEVIFGSSKVALSQTSLQSIIGGVQDAVGAAVGFLLQQKWPYFVWSLGIGCLSACFMFSYVRSRRILNMAIPVKSRKFRTRRGRRVVGVYLSDRISTPLTYGVLRPRIVLPKAMPTANRAHLNFAIRHEMTHIERHDMVFKALLLVCVCVHWFNPLVWVMYFLACRDIELSCDEKVVRSARKDRRKDYAMTLIELEEKRSLSLPLCAALGKTAIEERVVSIMKLKHCTVANVLAGALMVCLSLTVFADAEITPNEVYTTMTYVFMQQDTSTGEISAFHIGSAIPADASTGAYEYGESMPVAVLGRSKGEAGVYIDLSSNAGLSTESVDAKIMVVPEIETMELTVSKAAFPGDGVDVLFSTLGENELADYGIVRLYDVAAINVFGTSVD